MDEQELMQNIQNIEALAAHGDKDALLGNIAISLLRIANAQERLVAISEVDLETLINEQIEARAYEKATEIIEDKSKRKFIGKKA